MSKARVSCALCGKGVTVEMIVKRELGKMRLGPDMFRVSHARCNECGAVFCANCWFELYEKDERIDPPKRHVWCSKCLNERRVRSPVRPVCS